MTTYFVCAHPPGMRTESKICVFLLLVKMAGENGGAPIDFK